MLTQTQKIQKNDPDKAKGYFETKVNFTTGPVEVTHLIQDQEEGFVIVDVRAEKDFRGGHVPGAVNLPKDHWLSLAGLDKDKLNILYCYSQTCHLAAKAAVEFARLGYSVMEMDGGFKAWKEGELPIET